MKISQTQRFWKKNIGLKLLALVFALFLWFFVVGEEKAEVSLNVPLEIINMPDNMVISNDFNGMIDVRVYGPRSLVRELATQRLSHVVDLANAAPGRMTLHIKPDSIQLPRGVEVTRIHPSQITLVLEPFIRREVPVEPVLKGKMADDYELKGVDVKPPNVVLAGAAQEVSRVKRVSTRPVDISRLNKSTSAVVGLDLDTFHLKIVGEPWVTVQVKVEEKRIQKSLVIPLEVVGTKYNYKLNPSQIEVVLNGPISLLRNISHGQDIRAVLQVKGFISGTHVIQPIIQVPTGVEIEKMEPKSVKVTVFKK